MATPGTTSPGISILDQLSPAARLVAEALRDLSGEKQCILPTIRVAEACGLDEDIVTALLPELGKARLALWHEDGKRRPDAVMAYELLLGAKN